MPATGMGQNIGGRLYNLMFYDLELQFLEIQLFTKNFLLRGRSRFQATDEGLMPALNLSDDGVVQVPI